METIIEAVERLKEIPTFSTLSPQSLKWLAEKGTIHTFENDEEFISPGAEASRMFAVLEGKVQLFTPDSSGNGEFRPFLTMQKGDVGGYLPFSRMSKISAKGFTKGHTVLYVLSRDTFQEMIQDHMEIAQALVSLMTDRVRTNAKQQQAQAKLAALGKLSAGLAHELNNPASAIKRNASELYNILYKGSEKVRQLVQNCPEPSQIDEIIALVKAKKAERQSFNMSMMEKTALEDELADWLEDRGAEDGYSMTESFVEMGIGVNDLEEIAENIPDAALMSILEWLDASLTTKRLVREVQDASERISTLVASIKAYTHMDRASSMVKADINDGIKSTLSMLHHKYRKKNIQLDLHLADNLPKVNAFVGELNQVWTNIIDNAIDAMDREGILTIETWENKGFVQAKIQDNGAGIPEDIQTRIFEPFFTTKKQGEGSGIGLDIVRRIIDNHNADIKLNSEPGHTEFTICIPSVDLKLK